MEQTLKSKTHLRAKSQQTRRSTLRSLRSPNKKALESIDIGRQCSQQGSLKLMSTLSVIMESTSQTCRIRRIIRASCPIIMGKIEKPMEKASSRRPNQSSMRKKPIKISINPHMRWTHRNKLIACLKRSIAFQNPTISILTSRI